ncbi:hypothetical protein [Nonomuraea sp. NPDC050786]|uniref:hypothetical protein n=1 Tax=Nonomuraea sp. NPDC050786 TaxID=3154840 RepID=UPI0033D09BD0
MRISRIALPVSASLIALALHAASCAPALAKPGSSNDERPSRASLSIGLLEIPTNRVQDSRSHKFIVDHVNPGATFTRRLEIRNHSPEPHQVRLYTAAATIDHSCFTFAPGRAPNELTSWIRLSDSTLALPPHGSAPVKATITVPEQASKGERYAVIWAEISAPADASGSIALVNRVGIRTYLDVGPGGEPPSDFDVTKVVPQRTEDGRSLVVATISNTGQRALDLDGGLTLSHGPNGLTTGPIPISRGTTLAPGDHGDVTVALRKGLPRGPWKYRFELNSGWVTRTVTGTLTFPAKPGTGGSASFDSPLPVPLALAGPAALIAGISLVIGYRRFRKVVADRGDGARGGVPRPAG